MVCFLREFVLYWTLMPFDDRDFPGAPPDDRAANRSNRRLVAAWLFIVCGMILGMIVLGGATRLTGSGLSIMEWAPFRGALPPLGDAEWDRLFSLYKQIPQYQILNAGLGLDGFKQIFWLEWVHRLWGRLIGVVFLVPLVWFWATRRLERRLRPRLAIIFALGGLQGLVGWFMVASGFLPETTSVSPYRLVIHLSLALLLYSAILWTGLGVLQPHPRAPSGAWLVHRATAACCCLVALTMLAGGFVAGTHAGLDYNTFPLMDGRLVPEGYARLHPFALNLTENIAAVQFDHRLLATLTVIATAAAVAAGVFAPLPRTARTALVALGAGVAAQYAIGVLTLLRAVPAGLAVAHQGVAVLVLTAALAALHALRSARPAPVPVPSPA
jgi:cytochrome c oxidase assembly protein subunit 15